MARVIAQGVDSRTIHGRRLQAGNATATDTIARARPWRHQTARRSLRPMTLPARRPPMDAIRIAIAAIVNIRSRTDHRPQAGWPPIAPTATQAARVATAFEAATTRG